MAWSLGHTLICVLALLLGLLLGWLRWGRHTASVSASTDAQPATHQPKKVPDAAVAVTTSDHVAATAATSDDTSGASTSAAGEAASSAESPASLDPSYGEVEDAAPRQPEPAPVQVPAPVATPSVAGSSVTDDAPSRPTPFATPADAELEPAMAAAAEPAADSVVNASPASIADLGAGARGEADQELIASSQSDVANAADGVSGPADDLRRISGVGPKMVMALNAAGIWTFKQLAEADETTLRVALRSAGLRVSPSLATWPQQARDLLDGGADAATGSTRPMNVTGDKALA